MVVIEIAGMRLVNGSNAREHWAARSRRAKEQRNAGCFHVLAVGSTLPRIPANIRIVRQGPRSLDTDNLAISAKHLRDGIADAFGVDDGSSGLWFEYAQERTREYGVRIEISARSIA